MDEQPTDAGATTTPPAAPSPSASPESAGAGAPPEAKECIFCGEVIPGFADRCSHCGGFLPIAEGRAFGHHFFFFLTCLALFLGTLLPWEGRWSDLHGSDSILGGFLLVLAGYGMVAAFFNVFHRRMIVWPVILAAVDGAYMGWKRVFQIAGGEAAKAISWDGDVWAKKRALIEWLRLFGPGLWLVVIFATIFWFVFFVSIVQGGRAASARKEAEKAARAARKK